MVGAPAKTTTVHISNKSHLNLSFNLNQCGSGEIPYGGQITIEDSDTFTLLCLQEGCAVVETNGTAYAMRAPQGVFTFPDLRYGMRNCGAQSMRITWLRFSGYLVENYLTRAEISRTQPTFNDPQGEICKLLDDIFEASQRFPNRYCRMMAGLYSIFSLLLDREDAHRFANYVDNANYYAVKATEYIEHNFSRNISVNEIAAALGISRKHLYSVFNEIIHIPPRQYLIYYRIEKAAQRLKLPTLSIQEIAESVGYASPFYFAKEFKRLTGVTPSEYRKNPQTGEIFSYRTFVPVLREDAKDPALFLPIEDELLGVYSEPE